jgi:hypothetical protein
MHIHIPELPSSFMRRVRETGVDDLGQPVQRVVAEGGEPCRDVLRRARPGEELILASFSPFPAAGPFREFGPVYLLAAASEEEVRRDRLPLPAGRETDYLAARFALRAYAADQTILGGAWVRAEAAAEKVEELLAQPEVAFVDIRFPVFGCFACRLERAAEEGEVGFRYSEPTTARIGVAA